MQTWLFVALSLVYQDGARVLLNITWISVLLIFVNLVIFMLRCLLSMVLKVLGRPAMTHDHIYVRFIKDTYMHRQVL